MNSKQLSIHLHQVFFGGNWTSSCVKDQLSEVSWEESIKITGRRNSIATLTFHIAYYVRAQLGVFELGILDAHDELSFDHPPIESKKDWDEMRAEIYSEVERLVELISQFPDSKLHEPFVDNKYGSYFRNILGLIEHTHYHLGQIAVSKK